MTPDKTANETPRSLSPATATDTKADFEASILDSVELDLGDF